MQYAMVDGERREAFPGGRGTCGRCGAATIAKCGTRVLHHWAHSGRRNCDPWWENETEWHRAWKNLFPVDCREVCHVSPDGEVHRADIVTTSGIVVEVQHSPMSDAERSSREAFYGNMVWVVDGRAFRANFDIYHPLPDPSSAIAQDLVWVKASRPMQGAADGLFFRLSEARADFPDIDVSRATLRFGRLHDIREVADDVARTYRGDHQYDWVRPRSTWLDAACPVYIDFGEERLIRLDIYDETGLPCIRYVAKQTFLLEVMAEEDAHGIAPRASSHTARRMPGASV